VIHARQPPRRRLAGALALLSLGAAPTPAAAQPPTQPPGLSPETAPSTPIPTSERDLAYELGVQAETAGDHPRAAAAFERAYRLTAPAETGPRLLFLRASVAARLRADDGSPTTRGQLCHAQALLRDYLRDGATTSAEQTTLSRVEERLALASGPDCPTLLDTAAAPPRPAPTPTPVPGIQPPPTTAPTTSPGLPPRTDPTRPAPRTPGQRGLLASGVIGLGLAVGAFAVMGSGITLAQQANQRGIDACREPDKACTASVDDNISDLRSDGQRGNSLTRVGAVVGGLAVLTGVVLIIVGEHLHRRPRVAQTPHLVPSGLGLAARF